MSPAAPPLARHPERDPCGSGADRRPASTWAGRLDDLACLLMLLAVAAVLLAALVLQFGYGEAPCPLCLLQRVGMFGVCFGLLLRLRHGPSARATGLGLVFALDLLVVSVRQVMIDIAPRPGHAYVGSAVLGLHMPVWSVLISAALIGGFAARLALFGAGEPARPSPRRRWIAGMAGLAVTALGLANLVGVLLQCGVGACHTG